MVKTRTCSKCKEQKPIDEFKTDRSRKDGKGYICKPCNTKIYHQQLSPEKREEAKRNPLA